MKYFYEIWKTWRYRKPNVTAKIIWAFLLILFLTFSIISIFLYNQSLQTNLQYINANLNTSNEYIKHRLNSLHDQLSNDLTFIRKNYIINDNTKANEDYSILKVLQKQKKYLAIHLIDINGYLIHSTNENIRLNKQLNFKSNYGINNNQNERIKIYGTFRREKKAVNLAVTPLVDIQNEIIGNAIIVFTYNYLDSTLKANNSLHTELEEDKLKIATVLIEDYNDAKKNLNLSVDVEGSSGYLCVYPQNKIMDRFEILPLEFNKKLLDKTINQNKSVNQTIHIHEKGEIGNEYLVSLDYSKEFNTYILSMVGKSKVYQLTYSEMYKLLMVFFLLIIITPLLYYVLVKRVTFPLGRIVNILEALKKGEMPQLQMPPTHDELNHISDSLTELIENTKHTAIFAQSIGKGDLNVFYQTLGKNDLLGSSLVNMRNGLIKSQEKDNERNWIVSGNAEVSQILRLHNNIQILAHEVIQYLTEKIGALQGAIYITDQSKNYLLLELKAVYAYGKIHKENTVFKGNEGLVGQVATEKRIIILDKIPNGFLRRTSGILGDSNPNHILALPMIYESNVYGVLEFAGFNLEKRKINVFLQEVAIIIARTLNNMLQIEKNNQLLVDVQKKSDELLKQQKALQSSNFEKEKAQIQLQKINAQLEEQIDEVNKSQQRMRLLLENASEVIIVYEEGGIARYVSPSVKDILGYSELHLIGKQNKEHLHNKSIDIYSEMFAELIKNPFKQVTIQVQFLNKNGSYIWVEATGANKLKDPAIEGIIVNLRDITERRMVEEEQRIRSKMQALSENSTDLILRIENNNQISYINPIIQQLTELNPTDILNRDLSKTPLGSRIVEQILHINENVRRNNSIVYEEFIFETSRGQRNMIYSGIPEYDNRKKIESVLMVFHDISEQKKIENEVRKQNKKINDSINYASRIQGAIIHGVDELQKYVSNAFMFYKARDVVTGDFPWFKKIDDYLYIAACDCTGHGVPGALMSIIGFFHLNDVVASENNKDVSHILGRLNNEMTKTLKQDDENVRTKDGMDLALCRVSLKEKTIEFAGAHRPIFILKNGSIEEIKGSRYSIGGGKNKDLQQFKHKKVKLNEGDSFYIFSDGLTDQFGGQEIRKKKFGLARIRNILEENKSSDLNHVQSAIETSWNDWIGDSKQTDDVLLIGISL